MCTTCGCARQDPALVSDDHDDGRNITLQQLVDAADASDLSLPEVVANIAYAVQATTDQPRLSWSLDYDGTISADPPLFANLMRSLRAGGTEVTVLTGNPDAQQMLEAAGMGDCYDQVVVAEGEPDNDKVAAAKAAYCETHGVDFHLDDKKANVHAVADAGVNAARFYAGGTK